MLASIIFGMSLEQAAITALASVTGALCYLFNMLRTKSEACEKWRAEKEPLITMMAEKLGLARGTVDLINECPVNGCPYAGKLGEASASYSLKKETEKHEAR